MSHAFSLHLTGDSIYRVRGHFFLFSVQLQEAPSFKSPSSLPNSSYAAGCSSWLGVCPQINTTSDSDTNTTAQAASANCAAPGSVSPNSSPSEASFHPYVLLRVRREAGTRECRVDDYEARKLYGVRGSGWIEEAMKEATKEHHHGRDGGIREPLHLRAFIDA